MDSDEHGPQATRLASGEVVERRLPLILLVASILLGFGLALPIVEVQRLLLFEEKASLLQLAYELLVQGEILLGLVVSVFSIAFPVFKLGLLAWLCRRPPDAKQATRALGWVDRLGRWSMLDVLVVALVVFSVKSSGWATAATQPALYCFAGAVLLTMLAASWMRRRLRALDGGASSRAGDGPN